MNDILENIYNGYKNQEKIFFIKCSTLGFFLEFYASEMENLKQCEKCGSTGFITLSKEEKNRLQEKIKKQNRQQKSGNLFMKLAEKKINESAGLIKCGCKEKINKIRKHDKIIRDLIIRERLNTNLSWNTEISNFENMTDFRTHYILSLLAKFRNPLNDFQKCKSFWIHDYLLTKEKVWDLKNFNFIYLICTDITISNREWLIANLFHKCDKLFTYKVKSKKESRF